MDSVFNERQLAIELSLGDKEAFAKIYQHYSPKLHYKVFRILKSESITQEVLQDVFLKVWDNRLKIDIEKSFGSYLSCIAVNKCYDYFRKMNRDKKLQARFCRTYTANYSPIEEELTNKEITEILHKAVGCLPQKRREVFLLCKFNGMSYDEVSNLLGISTSTISDHIVKANHFIRNYFVQCNKSYHIEFLTDFHDLAI